MTATRPAPPLPPAPEFCEAPFLLPPPPPPPPPNTPLPPLPPAPVAAPPPPLPLPPGDINVSLMLAASVPLPLIAPAVVAPAPVVAPGPSLPVPPVPATFDAFMPPPPPPPGADALVAIELLPVADDDPEALEPPTKVELPLVTALFVVAPLPPAALRTAPNDDAPPLVAAPWPVVSVVTAAPPTPALATVTVTVDERADA